MTLLAVETSTFSGSAALIKDGTLLDEKTWQREGSHSEFLTVAVDELLKKHNLSVQHIDRLAVGLGPGSFTGIRVGVNFARTFGYSLDIPVYGLNSLHLLAAGVKNPDHQTICVLQYAFRDFCYMGIYKPDQGRMIEVESPRILTFDEFSRLEKFNLNIGSGAAMFFSRDASLQDAPFAKSFLDTSALDKSPAELNDWIHTIPLYIRASEAEERLRIR